ncbi:MAG: ABC transporter permease [Treponema sp.]|nr:ABC transporter permease [Treponema sp.]
MKKHFSDFKLILGLSIVSFLFLLVLVSFFYMPYNPNQISITEKLSFFSVKHIFGTDSLGRDVFSRVLVSLRISFFIGFAGATFGLIFGSLAGACGGYFGGIVDSIVTKIIDVQMAFPGILLALMLSCALGPGMKTTVLALSLMALPRFARIARSGFLRFRHSSLVFAEKARGASVLRIMFFHIFPNISTELLVTYSLSFATSIMSESGLSYLGLGIQPPDASFGKMLSDAQNSIFTSPWLIFVPAFVLALLIIGFTLISDGLTAGKESE